MKTEPKCIVHFCFQFCLWLRVPLQRCAYIDLGKKNAISLTLIHHLAVGALSVYQLEMVLPLCVLRLESTPPGKKRPRHLFSRWAADRGRWLGSARNCKEWNVSADISNTRELPGGCSGYLKFHRHLFKATFFCQSALPLKMTWTISSWKRGAICQVW